MAAAAPDPRPRSRPSGPRRGAFSAAGVRELPGLVRPAAVSPAPLPTRAVAGRGRVWGPHHRLRVPAAFASTPPPATGEAVRAFRAEGRRHVAVASLFLA